MTREELLKEMEHEMGEIKSALTDIRLAKMKYATDPSFTDLMDMQNLFVDIRESAIAVLDEFEKVKPIGITDKK